MSVFVADDDHAAMDSFLAEVFERTKRGRIDQDQFVELLAYVMVAVDLRSRFEVMRCFAEMPLLKRDLSAASS